MAACDRESQRVDVRDELAQADGELVGLSREVVGGVGLDRFDVFLRERRPATRLPRGRCYRTASPAARSDKAMAVVMSLLFDGAAGLSSHLPPLGEHDAGSQRIYNDERSHETIDPLVSRRRPG